MHISYVFFLSNHRKTTAQSFTNPMMPPWHYDSYKFDCVWISLHYAGSKELLYNVPLQVMGSWHGNSAAHSLSPWPSKSVTGSPALCSPPSCTSATASMEGPASMTAYLKTTNKESSRCCLSFEMLSSSAQLPYSTLLVIIAWHIAISFKLCSVGEAF